MKLNRFFTLAFISLVPALAFAIAPKASKPDGRVEVQFLEPERYADVRASIMDTRDSNGHLDRLREHVVRLAGQYLPADQKLQITFTEIDLAGDFPPGRPAKEDHIRVMKDIYPPRMAFAYRVTDAAGTTLRNATVELTDINYLTTGSLTDRSDALRYDKKLLSDWFATQFPRR
jgi:hypothetical protein